MLILYKGQSSATCVKYSLFLLIIRSRLGEEKCRRHLKLIIIGKHGTFVLQALTPRCGRGFVIQVCMW